MHDIASGGLGVAVTEMAVGSGCGYQLARVPDHESLFSESPSRVVACVDPELVQAVLNVCDEAGVPTVRIGVAGGERCWVKGLYELELDAVTTAWRDRLPDALGSGSLH